MHFFTSENDPFTDMNFDIFYFLTNMHLMLKNSPNTTLKTTKMTHMIACHKHITFESLTNSWCGKQVRSSH